ncbi:unannotated protein [freshwater metagenome]|uniref:Unannotated protein n=1 Tax=freshwater metagenome TaxID=449393 RepID=A0A6J6JCI3_9ZZZZ
MFDVAACERCATEKNRDIAELLCIEFLQVVTHDDGGLHEKSTHTKCIGIDLFDLLDHLLDADLDANVVYFVAIVGADDVDKVLANVVDVALHGGKNKFALRAAFACLFHVLLEVSNSGLHGLGTLQNERQLHTARAKQFAHFAHTVQQNLVDDVECCNAVATSQLKIFNQAFSVTVDDALTKYLLNGPVGAVDFDCLDCRHASKDLKKRSEWVVALFAAVINEVLAHRDLFFRNSSKRKNLGCMNNGGVETVLTCFVEEHTVQYLTSCRAKSKAHI